MKNNLYILSYLILLKLIHKLNRFFLIKLNEIKNNNRDSNNNREIH